VVATKHLLVAHLIHCVWVPSPLTCFPPHVVCAYGPILPALHHLSSYQEILVLHSLSLSHPHGLQQCLETTKSFKTQTEYTKYGHVACSVWLTSHRYVLGKLHRACHVPMQCMRLSLLCFFLHFIYG